ncbi:MAG: hypothetical protein ACXACA_02385 [Candidatus Ranarchaeia archaeon]|jgi:predicted regulator of Ras-like GTPase activity (Roadblock/LC7/MglB family)
MGYEDLVKCMKEFMAESDAIELVALVDRDGLVLHADSRKAGDEILLTRVSSAVSSLFSDATSRLAMGLRRIDFRTPDNDVFMGIDYGEGQVLCIKISDRRSYALIGYLAEIYRPRIQKIIQEF